MASAGVRTLQPRSRGCFDPRQPCGARLSFRMAAGASREPPGVEEPLQSEPGGAGVACERWGAHVSWFDYLDVRVSCADVLGLEADAIACGVRTDLQLYGSVGKALDVRGGTPLRQQIRQLKENLVGGCLQLGEATTIPAHGLPGAANLVLVAFWGAESAYTAALLRKSYTSVLRQAFGHGFERLAIPLLGGDPWASRFEQYCNSIVYVLQELDALPVSEGFSIRTLELATVRADQCQQLRETLRTKL